MTLHPVSTLTRAAAAAALCAGLALAAPASAHAHGSKTAPGVDIATTDPRFGIDEAYTKPDQADALGARWSRIPFIWNIVQKDGPASWNNFALGSTGSAAVVKAELARNRSVVGLLLGTPSWARQQMIKGSGRDWGQASAPDNIAKPWAVPGADAASWTGPDVNYWGNYAYKIAKQFNGDNNGPEIDDWVIWNEVSIPPGQWVQWHGSVDQYVQVVKTAYTAIHAANPRAKIILYGDPYWYDHSDYLRQLYNKLAAADPGNAHNGYFDVANLHLYSNPTDFFPIIRTVKRLLRAHGWSNKQVWVSETNAEPNDATQAETGAAGAKLAQLRTMDFRTTMQGPSGFLVDAFASYIAAGANRIELYRMFDGAETAAGLPAWGLVNNQNQLRPVAHTFRFLIDLFKDPTIVNPDTDKGEYTGSYTAGDLVPDATDGLNKAGVFKVALTRKDGGHITVLWNQTGQVTDPIAKKLLTLPVTTPGGTHYAADGTATYHLKAHRDSAIVYDKCGAAKTIAAKGGYYTFTLQPGVDFTNQFDRRVPTVGGDPVIVTEGIAPIAQNNIETTPACSAAPIVAN